MKLLSVFIFLLAFSAFASDTAKNKAMAKEFFELAFNKHQPAKAAQKYLSEDYIQHNPHAATGPKPFIQFFESFFKQHPKFRMTIKRIIAEGDLVVVHSHAQETDSDPGSAVVDIMRVKNGKFAEHWDVIQEVPEKSANNNTMF